MLKTSTPGNPELDFLRTLNAAIESFSTFAPDHVRCADCVRRLLAEVGALLTASAREVVIRCVNHVLEVGATRYSSRDFSLVQLEERFQKAGIHHLGITPGITREELRVFLQILVHRIKDGLLANIEHDTARAGLVHISVGSAQAIGDDDADETDAGHALKPVPEGLWALARPIDDRLYWRAVERVRALCAAIRLGHIPNAYGVREATEMLIGPMRADRDALIPAVFQPQELDWELSHAARCAILAMRVGLGLTDDEASLRLLGESALLHDIGFFAIAPEILHKNGPLSDEERTVVQQHIIEGVRLLLTGSDFPPAAVEAALLHHSTHAPGGYPDVSETSTPSTVAKIVKVVDAYESIIGTRPYRRSRSPCEAAEELIREAGASFDRAVVGRFVRTIGFFPIGSMVRLSDGAIAQVRAHDPAHMLAPKVAVLLDGAGEIVAPPRDLDLADEELDLTVKEGLPSEREPAPAQA
jgi:hypothetical protein